MKNIVVIGLGSMGRRRIRLLKRIDDSFNIIGVDSNDERLTQSKNEFNIKVSSDVDDVLKNENIDIAIISTGPLSHASLIEKCLNANCDVFTEINLVNDNYDTNMKLAKEKNKVLFLSSTFLYKEEITYIKEKVHSVNDIGEHINWTYHVGQYLPDWHPWESIKNYFIGDKRTNGCRELFAIELPWIIKTFGEILSFNVVKSKNTKLPIEYNDNYLLLIKHKNGNSGILALDVISRKPVRNLEIFSENLYISWDGKPIGLNEYDFIEKKEKNVKLYNDIVRQDGYADFIVENSYTNELTTFLSLVKENSENYNNKNHYSENKIIVPWTFDDDIYVLDMINKIENGDNNL